MAEKVKIKIIGVSGIGKTTILHIIGRVLADSGFKIRATDDDGVACEIDDKPLCPHEVDSRLISISTSLV